MFSGRKASISNLVKSYEGRCDVKRATAQDKIVTRIVSHSSGFDGDFHLWFGLRILLNRRKQ